MMSFVLADSYMTDRSGGGCILCFVGQMRKEGNRTLDFRSENGQFAGD